jgi:DNA-binding HxlR family transcriptional regulator
MPAFEFKGKTYNNAAELALDLVGGKYKMPILWRLKDKVWRYGELKADLGKITHKMLTEQLRELERDGLVHRKVYPEIPPKVEYSITAQGRLAVPVIEALRHFGSEMRQVQTVPDVPKAG